MAYLEAKDLRAISVVPCSEGAVIHRLPVVRLSLSKYDAQHAK